MNLQRVHTLNHNDEIVGKAVAYWMSRDQRVDHNWALVYAAEKAYQHRMPLYVFFALTPSFCEATIRQYDFMLKGLQEVERQLQNIGFGFIIIPESPEYGIPKLVKEYDIGTLVCDFSPLRIGRSWRNSIASTIPCAMYEVDAHNIVPCRIASQKQEYSARTIRPKIYNLLPTFLDIFPEIYKAKYTVRTDLIDWAQIYSSLEVNKSIKPVEWAIPGTKAAIVVLKDFLDTKLTLYDNSRNDVSRDGQSNLSPYLHFGQISAQFVAQQVLDSGASQQSKDVYLEELITRRELSDNYCYYNQSYDSFDGFPDWAKKTLKKHVSDKREFIYSLEEFEEAKTHDEVWNFAQKQMVEIGKMHGYLRMYWAKKILEWTKNPQEAMKIAIYLNDKYELDGRDPNGYVGISWSIGAVHDRPWFERKIYGMIRYMSNKKIKKRLKLL